MTEPPTPTQDTANADPLGQTRDVARTLTPALARPFPEPSAVGPRAILTILRRRLIPLLTCVILIPLCAALAIHRITPAYTATGMLIYEPSEYKVRELQSILRTDPTTEAVMASQAEILRSLHIAQKVAERGNLFANPEFNRALRPPGGIRPHLDAALRFLGLREPETVAPPIYGPRLAPDRDATLLAVQAALKATAVRFSRVIEVSFTAEDPHIAAAAVNNAMDAYVKDQFAAKHRAVARATEWLEKRAFELRRDLRAAERQIAQYRAEQHLSQGMHAGLDAEQISHLNEDLVRARGELAGAESRLDAARGRAGAAAQAAIASSVVQLRVQQEQLQAQAQAQQGRLGPNHPEAEGLRRQVAETQRAVAAEIARVIAATESDRRSAFERVATLERNLRIAQEEAERNAKAQLPLNAQTRDADALRAQLQAVLERIQQTAQQAVIETAEGREISQALPPEHPSAPKSTRLLAAALAAGLGLGLMLVYALEKADTTLQSGEAVRAATGLPCFALLPEIGKRALGHGKIEDYVARRPLTAFAEQIRALRAGLWFGANRPRVIAVTAARPAEGKTILTISLGRSARLAGERVMLVECDLRQPSFVRRFNGGDGVGLADVLKGEATLEEVIREDPIAGLHYIHAGKPRAGRQNSDILGLFLSAAMAELLIRLRRDYDLIVLDAPPAQAMTEARAIAAVADATLLAVRWRSTPVEILRHARTLLDEAHAVVVGTVLTRVDPRAHVRSGYADAEVYHRRYRPYYRG